MTRIAVRRTLEAVEVDVEDAGPGFGDADLARAFEPFFRKTGSGLGLGLSLVDRIARAHGGSARAVTREGGGARVTIRIPRGSP